MRKFLAVGVTALALAAPSSAMAWGGPTNFGNIGVNANTTVQTAVGGTALAINAGNFGGKGATSYSASATANATNSNSTTQSNTQLQTFCGHCHL